MEGEKMNKIALMEDDKIVKLSIPRGYYVFAEMSTMADFNVKMMLRDAQSQKVSFEGERQSKDAEGTVSFGTLYFVFKTFTMRLSFYIL